MENRKKIHKNHKETRYCEPIETTERKIWWGNTVLQRLELQNSEYKISIFNMCKEIKEGIEI